MKTPTLSPPSSNGHAPSSAHSHAPIPPSSTFVGEGRDGGNSHPSSTDSLSPLRGERVGDRGHSGGPKTLAGKSQSRLNAITHGHTVSDDVFVSTLLGENKQAFDKLRRSLMRFYRPRTEYEKLLVERLAICHFRILRLSRHESIALQVSEVGFRPDRSIVPHLDRFSRYDMRLERQINTLHNRLVSAQKSRGSNIPKPLPFII